MAQMSSAALALRALLMVISAHTYEDRTESTELDIAASFRSSEQTRHLMYVLCV